MIKNTTSTTVVMVGYQVYIDTNLKINNRMYGSYMLEYKPLEEDLFKKKAPEVFSDKEKYPLKRDVCTDETRYLHIINKTKTDVITGLAKVFNFIPPELETDVRPRILDTPRVQVIDYTALSVCIFTKDIQMLNYLRGIEERGVRYGAGYIGPNNVKTPGFILAKKSSKYQEIMDTLKSGVFKVKENKIETISDSDSKYRISGENAYVVSKIEELTDDGDKKYNILSDSTISDHRVVEIELISKK